MPYNIPDHYATLGLHRRATDAQICAAYRLLARQHHPDIDRDSPDAVTRTQAINAAYETLKDAGRRRTYDRELAAAEKPSAPARAGRIERNLSQDVHLRLDEFIRGTALEVRVSDPANPNGPETYELTVPAETAPGTRFRMPRAEPFAGGFIVVRVRARPDSRFKVRGSDLRGDLRISSQRAAQGGVETIRGISGDHQRLQIPKAVARGETLKIPGQGLPKARGGRGDLFVRITYRPEVRITRSSGR